MDTKMMIKKLNNLKNKIMKEDGFEIDSNSENMYSIKDEIKKKIFLLLTQMGIKEISFQFVCDFNDDSEEEESILSESYLNHVVYCISSDDSSETNSNNSSKLIKKYGEEVVDALYKLCLAPAEVVSGVATDNRVGGEITYKPMEMAIILNIETENNKSEDFDECVWSPEE